VNYEFEIRVKIFRLQEVVAVNYFSNTTVNFTCENSQQLWKLYTHSCGFAESLSYPWWTGTQKFT